MIRRLRPAAGRSVCRPSGRPRRDRSHADRLRHARREWGRTGRDASLDRGCVEVHELDDCLWEPILVADSLVLLMEALDQHLCAGSSSASASRRSPARSSDRGSARSQSRRGSGRRRHRPPRATRRAPRRRCARPRPVAPCQSRGPSAAPESVGDPRAGRQPVRRRPRRRPGSAAPSIRARPIRRASAPAWRGPAPPSAIRSKRR